MKCLVTGGFGFIGSNMVERLLSEGNEVVVVDNLSTGRIGNLTPFLDNPLLTVKIMDICDGQALFDVIADNRIEYVFHFAALPSVEHSVRKPWETETANVLGSVILFSACTGTEVKRIVCSSSSAVYGDKNPEVSKAEDDTVSPESPYGLSKYSMEQHAKNFITSRNADIVCLRYFNVYGKNQNPFSQYSAVIPKFVSSAIDGRGIVVYGDGNQTRDFTHVSDIVDANIKVALSRSVKRPVYNVATGESVSINGLIAIIEKIFGRTLSVEYKPAKLGDIVHSSANVDNVCGDIGLITRKSLFDGLLETKDYYKPHKGE